MLNLLKRRDTARLPGHLNQSSEPTPTSSKPVMLPESLVSPKPPVPPAPIAPFELPPIGCPILTLPTELFYRITAFNHVDSMAGEEQNVSSLSQLVFVNKRFNQVYTPLLYENVNLGSYERLLQYHRNSGAMNNSRFTTSLSIACTALLKYDTPPHGATWPEILSPLFEMQDLRKLVIRRSGGMCSYSNLGHPALEYLTSQAANPAFLPNLSILEVPHHPRLFTLCTGRPITVVRLGPNVAPLLGVEFEEHVPELAEGTQPLEELSLYWPATETEQTLPSKISQVVKLCPRLQLLDMRLPKGFAEFMDWNGNNFELGFIPWVQNTLASLSELTHLNLHISQPREIPIGMQESTSSANGHEHLVLMNSLGGLRDQISDLAS
ncbi:hypothetical protein FRC08_013894 [Ceratobasidium sp. 394]|nr:hypothetical protein FRC08_013894 [Ceratobasidium sp. 394]